MIVLLYTFGTNNIAATIDGHLFDNLNCAGEAVGLIPAEVAPNEIPN